jgi:deoxyribonuclease-4
LKLGAHISIAKSIDLSVDRALSKGCNTFQIFTRNPRGWFSKKLDSNETRTFIKKVDEEKITPIFAHMPYLPNLASPRHEIYRKSIDALKNEIKRCNNLKIPYLVTHLGSHLGSGSEEGIKLIVNAINEAIKDTKNNVKLLLENSSGSKNSIGSTFEEINDILSYLNCKHSIFICLDTCHAFASGYDLRSKSSIKKVLNSIDDTFGLDKIKLIHANDSKEKFYSRKDRHEHIGLGHIRIKGFRYLIESLFHKELTLPYIIETPIDERRSDSENLHILRKIFRTLKNGYFRSVQSQ